MSIPEIILTLFSAWVLLVFGLWIITWRKREAKHKAPYQIPYVFPNTTPAVSETILLNDRSIKEVYSKTLDYFNSMEEYGLTYTIKWNFIHIKIKKHILNELIEVRYIQEKNVVQGLARGVFGYIRINLSQDANVNYLKIIAVPDEPLKEDISLHLWRKVVHDYLKYMNLEMIHDGYSRVYSKEDEETIEKYKWTHY
jgi:hypothetical protein